MCHLPGKSCPRSLLPACSTQLQATERSLASAATVCRVLPRLSAVCFGRRTSWWRAWNSPASCSHLLALPHCLPHPDCLQEMLVATHNMYPCNHPFCGECLAGWLGKGKRECPTCRQAQAAAAAHAGENTVTPCRAAAPGMPACLLAPQPCSQLMMPDPCVAG